MRIFARRWRWPTAARRRCGGRTCSTIGRCLPLANGDVANARVLADQAHTRRRRWAWVRSPERATTAARLPSRYGCAGRGDVRRLVGTRARRAAADRRGMLEPRDRGALVHQPAHRGQPRPLDPAEDRMRQSRPRQRPTPSIAELVHNDDATDRRRSMTDRWATFIRSSGAFWHPVAWSHEVVDRPMAVTLLGEPLVVVAAATGEVDAFIDECPHRGAPLEPRSARGRRTGLRVSRVAVRRRRCGDMHSRARPRGDRSRRGRDSRKPAEVCERYGIVWVALERATAVDRRVARR